MTEPTKRCPLCAEEILAAAMRCKHCGADFGQIAGQQQAAVIQKQVDNRKAGCALFVTVGFLGCMGYAWWSCSNAWKVASHTTPTTQPDVAVELPEIIREFKTNEVAAASKYGDRYVVTSGKVQSVGPYGSDFYVIFDVGAWAQAECYTSQRQKVEALQPGDPIRVRARATGHIIYLQLKDCLIL